jgi:hypothetical protein
MFRCAHAAIVSAVFLCPFSRPANVLAGSVSLPFSESFNTITTDAVTAYPAFTAQVPPSQPDPMWSVNAAGRLRSDTTPYIRLKQPSFSVKPDPLPTGEIVIKLDIGWDGSEFVPPIGPGYGGCGIRLGQFENTTESENTVLFHPGYPAGAFRVDGDGGYPNQDMGWSPAPGVMHHMEIHSFPDGLFNITVTDGTDPAKVYTNSFSNLFAYGGDVGLLAHGEGAAFYDNLSITLAGQTVTADLDADSDVDGNDFLLIQRSLGSTTDASTVVAWKSAFGTLPATPNITAVPEPTSPILLFTAAMGLGAMRRRRDATYKSRGGYLTRRLRSINQAAEKTTLETRTRNIQSHSITRQVMYSRTEFNIH